MYLTFKIQPNSRNAWGKAYYNDYCAFFQKEIGENGVPKTVNKFLFSGDDRAEDMLCRFFSGE